MVSVLLILIASALLCAALNFVPRWRKSARIPALLGVGFALVVTLVREGLAGGGAGGTLLQWPAALAWIGEPIYRSDALSAGLGAWCLLLGGMCLLTIRDDEHTPWRLAVGILTVATLYSLVHTWHLLAFAAQVLLLALLTWAYRLPAGAVRARDTHGERQTLALGLGSALLVCAALLIGRTTGGAYNLADLSISALTVWPLALMALYTLLWLGMAPATGWSAGGGMGKQTLVGALVLGVPPIVLLLRLQALLTNQALAGTVPPTWSGFTFALAVLGGVTALVAAAGIIVWAGTSRWPAYLAAHALGLALLGLGLDTPLGRVAALAILLSYGLARVTLALAAQTTETHSYASLRLWEGLPRGIAIASLAAAPLTAGFVGVWLLGGALSETGRPLPAVALVGALVLAACGLALAAIISPNTARDIPKLRYAGWVGVASGVALVVGGALPGLWLPQVQIMAGIAGGTPSILLPWQGLAAGGESLLPALPLVGGVILLAGGGWLLSWWAKSRVTSGSPLLPSALERLGMAGEESTGASPNPQSDIKGLLANPPAPIWWLSLAWLEEGVWGFGTLLGRLGVRSGNLLSRLEGRFYLPLAIIMTLVTLLIITR